MKEETNKMINEQYKKMLEGKSVIRQLSEFATARGKEIGYENVFDYSLGNPSVPVPDAFNEEMIHLIQTKSSMEIHGYSPSLGITSVREKIADLIWNIRQRTFFRPQVQPERLHMRSAV